VHECLKHGTQQLRHSRGGAGSGRGLGGAVAKGDTVGLGRMRGACNGVGQLMRAGGGGACV